MNNVRVCWHAVVGPLCEPELTGPPCILLRVAEYTDVKHHYLLTEMNDECWHRLLSTHWQTQSRLPPLCCLCVLFTTITESSSAGIISIFRVAPTLFLVSKLGWSEAQRDFLAFKEEGSIKNACRCFLSLRSHQWLQVDNTISHHGNELGWAHSLWMPIGFLFRMAFVPFLNRWKPGRVADNLVVYFRMFNICFAVWVRPSSTLALTFTRKN